MNDINEMQQPAGQPGQSKKRYIIWAVIAVAVILVLFFSARIFTGFKGANVNVDVNRSPDGGTFTVTGENGEKVTVSSGGDVKLPSNWPSDVPIMDGAKITYSGSVNPSTGKPGAVVTISTSRSVADVADYYEKQLAASGWQIEGVANAMGSTVFSATKGDKTVGLYIGGEEGTTMATISVEGQ